MSASTSHLAHSLLGSLSLDSSSVQVFQHQQPLGGLGSFEEGVQEE